MCSQPSSKQTQLEESSVSMLYTQHREKLFLMENHLIVYHGLKEVCPPEQKEELRLKLQLIIILKQFKAIKTYYHPSVFEAIELSLEEGILLEFPEIYQQHIIRERAKTKAVITIRDITEYDTLKTEKKGWAILIPDEEDALEPCWCPYFIKENLTHTDS